MAFIIDHYPTLLCICIIFSVLPAALSLGNQITLQEHKKIAEYLTKEVAKKYPNDGADKYSDAVTQATKGKIIAYHRGDEAQPVFLTTDATAVGKKVIVLRRGDDYITPEDKQTFVVLRQKGGGKEYNLHLAVVYDMGRHANGNKVVAWTDGRVEQQANVSTILNVMGNRYIQRPRPNDKRPRCEWIGSLLLCNSKKTVAAKGRAFRPAPATITPDADKEDLSGNGNGTSAGDAGASAGGAEETGGDAGGGEGGAEAGGGGEEPAGGGAEEPAPAEEPAEGGGGETPTEEAAGGGEGGEKETKGRSFKKAKGKGKGRSSKKGKSKGRSSVTLNKKKSKS